MSFTLLTKFWSGGLTSPGRPRSCDSRVRDPGQPNRSFGLRLRTVEALEPVNVLEELEVKEVDICLL